jgi:hypothetical protein
MEIGTIIVFIVLAVIIIVIVLYILSRMKGKIIINLDKNDFSAGETINGTVILKLKKPIEATALNIGLVGTREKAKYSRNSKGEMSKSTSSENICNFNKEISGKKLYPAGESSYPFQLVVPKDIGKFSTGNQVADAVIKSVQFLAGADSKVNWVVKANLDMKGFDLGSSVKVNIN